LPLKQIESRRTPQLFREQTKKGYNLFMQLAVFVMRLLEIMFFVGLAGSSVVVLISFAEDAIELFGEDEPTPPRE
jgi:hypothetical protein